MPQMDLSAGTIGYEDSGGDGPVVVLLHGVAMDGGLWRNVVPRLRPDGSTGRRWCCGRHRTV